MKYFFTVISYIFHPFIIPLLGLFVMFESPTLPNSYNKFDALYFFPDEAKIVIYIVLGVLTFLAPAFSLLIMYWNKMISSLELENRKERMYPFVLVTFYFILAYFYLKVQLPPVLKHPALMGFILGIIITFVISFLINFYMKISMHAAAIFGVCGTLLAYNQSQIESNLMFLLYMFCIAGLVSSARIYLKAHTLRETVVGIFVGFIVMYSTVKSGLILDF